MRESEVDQALPLVSIVMPTYNHAAFIKDSIESVLSQTYKHLELIVIDNYSTDDTEQIVKSFINLDGRIRYLRFRNHGIIAASRNFGIANSKGKFIAFLDSDDMWHPSKLESQLNHFANDEIVAVGSDAVYVSSTPYYRPVCSGRGRDGYIDYGYHSILSTNPVMTSSVVVRRYALQDAEGFDESPEFRFIEDWELWLRMSRLGRFRILGEQLLRYRVHTDMGRDRAAVAERCFRILERQIELGYITDHACIREVKASMYLSIGSKLLQSGDCRESGRSYLDAFKHSSRVAKRTKACIGYLVSLQSPIVRRVLISIFYKANKAICYGRDMCWRINTVRKTQYTAL